MKIDPKRPAIQRGFSLMSAIFLIVVVAMVAGFAVSIGNVQRSGSVLALVDTRVGFAAQSGLDWAVATVTSLRACPAPGTRFTADGPGLAGIEISVGCNAVAVTEGAAAYTMFALDVTARHGAEGSEDYAQRRVTAQVADGAP